jgi:hypothetical protein
MKQSNNKPFTENLDHKHRNKSELLFYKLLAKQKFKHRDWSDVRTDIYPEEPKPGGNPNDTI